MGLDKKQIFFLFIIVIICGFSKAEVFKVGDEAGWTTIGKPDYKSWAATKTFHVGDSIVFNYNKEFHNVVRVTHKNYKLCNATGPYGTWTSGNDTFIIKNTGHFYFISSFADHCRLGQKVDIRVPASGPTSSPTPTPSQPSSPSPSSVPEDSSSPSPAPSPVEAKSSAFSLSKGVITSKLFVFMMALAFCVSGNL